MDADFGSVPLEFELKVVGSCILVVSVAYTYLISRLTSNPTPLNPPPNPQRAQQRASRYKELENRKRKIARTPFHLGDLPPELAIIILGYTAQWPGTVAQLVKVSRAVQEMTYEACLPRMPLRLIRETQVRSFERLLLHKPHLAPFVHHLWVTPQHEEYYPAAIRILKQCTHVQSLAVNARILQEAVTAPYVGYRIRHTRCRDLTLLYTSREGWATLLSSASTSGNASTLQFMRQITHLRLVGDVVPTSLSLPNLRAFSYALNRNTLNLSHGERMLKDKENLPRLLSVVLVGERPGNHGVRITKMKDSKTFVFEVPRTKTELDLWSENTMGSGFWQLCAD